MFTYLDQPVELKCENCGGCAPVQNDAYTCQICGKRREVGGFSPEDLYFQTTVRGCWLWAYNRAHLTLMLRYISAKERSKVSPRHSDGFAGRFHKLPKQLVSAKNRDAVVKAITRLLHDR